MKVYDTETLLEGHEKGIMDVAALKLSKFGGISLEMQENFVVTLELKCVLKILGEVTFAALLHLGISCDPSRLLNVCDFQAMFHLV